MLGDEVKIVREERGGRGEGCIPGGYRNPPGEVLGLVGLIGGEEKGPHERGEGVLDKGVSGQPDYILWPNCWTMKIQD